MVIDLGGIHALEENTGTIFLTAGIHPLEIYFAERHLTQSGFYFEFLDEDVEIVSVIYWDDITANIGETVAFKGSCSYDVDGTIQDYSWDFGDEETGTGQLPEHAYDISGYYTVTLTVTDDDGATGTDTCLVTIVNNPPVADAGPDQTVYVGEEVILDGSGSHDVGGSIASYSWSFGDGLASQGKMASHLYSQPGVYTVTLTVVDNQDAWDTDECTVTVRSLPNLEYTLEYLDPADQTIVDSTAIWFYTSGAYPEYSCYVPYNSTFTLPASDYGTYLLYNRSTPVHYRITIRNLDSVAHDNVQVKAMQERHNDMTIWDRYGRLDLQKGELMGGDSTAIWTLSLGAGQTVVLDDNYHFEGRGWGLDQTHLVITMGSHTIVDDSEAGVYCPP
jgi:chitodextrinase